MSEQYETSGYVTIPEGTLYYKIYGRKRREKSSGFAPFLGNQGSPQSIFSSYKSSERSRLSGDRYGQPGTWDFCPAGSMLKKADYRC